MQYAILICYTHFMLYASIFLLVLAAFLWLLSRSLRNDEGDTNGSVLFRWCAVFAATLSVITGIWSSFRVVPAGYVGVKVMFGNVESKPVYAGLHLVNPLCNIVNIPVRTMEYTMVARSNEGSQSGDDSVPLFTKDTMRLNADVTVIYRVNPESVPWLYRTIGNATDFEKKVIRPSSRSAFRQGALKYTMLEQLGDKRAALEDDLQSLIIEAINGITSKSLDYTQGTPFIIQEVLVRNIEPPERFKAAVEAKLIADQDAQKMRFVLDKERQEAERKAIEAEGIRKFQSIVRQGIDEQLLRWKGIEATVQLAESNNTKIVIIGQGKDGLPLILNGNDK